MIRSQDGPTLLQDESFLSLKSSPFLKQASFKPKTYLPVSITRRHLERSGFSKQMLKSEPARKNLRQQVRLPSLPLKKQQNKAEQTENLQTLSKVKSGSEILKDSS